LILAIDTATRFISLALHDGKRLLLESTWLTANNRPFALLLRNCALAFPVCRL